MLAYQYRKRQRQESQQVSAHHGTTEDTSDENNLTTAQHCAPSTDHSKDDDLELPIMLPDGLEKDCANQDSKCPPPLPPSPSQSSTSSYKSAKS